MSSPDARLSVSDLVEQYYELLYRFAYRLSGSSADAEDLVQQAFLAAHAKLDQLRESDKVRSWLFTIVHNAFRKQVRRQHPQAFSTLPSEPDPQVEAQVDAVADADALQTALNQLTEEHRTPLILFYFEDFSYKQIAEMLDIPVGTVMSRLSRGKEHLRERMAPAYEHASSTVGAERK
ncbi:MAG: RNA polymerase sigma factor [Planctomycetota bacterium]|nr:MAG: RNA polymerase sigma factor [Planctomycetota bacterium]